MYGFYQFKDNKYYNKPIGARAGLSIFPYIGVNNNLPYQRPIPILRGRYSKSRLVDDNTGYPEPTIYHPDAGNRPQSQFTRGPLPYIYKLRLSGISNAYSCNQTCEILNDRDFYLYGWYLNTIDLVGAQAQWVGTICDASNPNGIYIKSPTSEIITISFGVQDNKIGDNYYDLLILTLIESLDEDVDKSYLILTLGSTLYYGPLPGSILSPNERFYPLIFVKEFAAGERVFALEESIELTPTEDIQIDHGVRDPFLVDIQKELKVNQNAKICNFGGGAATLTPFQTELFDIQNNFNMTANHQYFGVIDNDSSSIPITTSSGIFNVDKATNTSNITSLDTPGQFKLTLNSVTTENQGNHVPCETYFNKEFYLKPALIYSDDWFINRNQFAPSYFWDSELERQSMAIQNNYLGLEPHAMFTRPAYYLDNIALSVAGTGGYLQLNFYHDTDTFVPTPPMLSFRHPYSITTTPLRTTTFTNWSLHTDDGSLTSQCNFDNVGITLEPIINDFKQSTKTFSCAPLCSDNTTPTSINIDIRISGYVLGSDCSTGGTRFYYDQTLNIIADLKSSFFDNDISAFTGNGDQSFDTNIIHGGNNGDGIYYFCNDNGEDEATVNFAGTTSVPVESLNYTVCFTGVNQVHTATFSSISLNYIANNFLRSFPHNVSGCPIRLDCSVPINFQGTPVVGGNTPYDAVYGRWSLWCSGTAVLDGFL